MYHPALGHYSELINWSKVAPLVPNDRYGWVVTIVRRVLHNWCDNSLPSIFGNAPRLTPAVNSVLSSYSLVLVTSVLYNTYMPAWSCSVFCTVFTNQGWFGGWWD